MAIISSQSTRSSGRVQTYAKKDSVAESAVNATVPGFERRLKEIRRAHGKDGIQPSLAVDESGKLQRDKNGDPVIATDKNGKTIYESKDLEAYSLVQSFGHDELDPSDPESWLRANELGLAVGKERFPGHPVLVATEINGRSGCVHNHIIVGAVHPETGMSIDSNLVTHSRLALAHDQVLTANGFAQREDMARITEAATAEIEARRQAAVAEEGFDELTPSQQKRRLTAAENSVRLESRDTSTAHERREAKRLRELHRYEENEQDRAIAHELGITPPAEKFCEFELEGRIRKTLNDPRATSWESVVEIGRENLVTIDQRGKEDITYGMMLAQPDGTIAEPSRSHRRRGGIEGAKSPGLGDGFRRDDVEKAIEGNIALQAEMERSQTAADQRRADQQAKLEREDEERQRLIAERLAERNVESTETGTEIDAEVAELQGRFEKRGQAQQPAVAEQPEPEATTVQAADEAELADDGKTVDEVEAESEVATEDVAESEIAEPAFRSGLRDVGSKDNDRLEKINAVAQLEEDYHGRTPDAEFERRAAETRILGPKFLEKAGGTMSQEFREHVEARVAQAAERASAYDERQVLRDRRDELKADRKSFDEKYDREVTQNRRDNNFYDKHIAGIDAARTEGDYSSRAHEVVDHADTEKARGNKAALRRGADVNAKDPDYQDRQARIAESDKRLDRDMKAVAARDRSQSNENDGLG